MDDDPADIGGKADRDAEFALFYKEQTPRLVAFLMVFGVPHRLAPDVAQEAMLEAYRKWDHIDHPGAWIRTVASRTWWRWREQKRPEVLVEDAGEWTRSSADESEKIVNRYVFLTLLERLPPEQRQVMAWTYDGFQPNEIAAELGKDPATVRSSLREARKKLRQQHRTDEEAP
jgi:RNA polymerase sigma factor (sigma-70 family)